MDDKMKLKLIEQMTDEIFNWGGFENKGFCQGIIIAIINILHCCEGEQSAEKEES